MSKNTISRPSTPRPAAPTNKSSKTQQPPSSKDAKRAQGPSAQSLRTAKAKEAKKGEKAPKAAAPKAKAPRAHGAHAAADHHDEDAGPHGAGSIEAMDSAEDMHRRRSGEVEYVEHEEHTHDVDESHETAAVGPDAIKRSMGGDTGGGDGFEGGDKQREAYERYMKGNVASDKERFDELRKSGKRDDFNAELAPPAVEALGVNRATAHVVRIYEKWTLDGVPRDEAVNKAAELLAGFTQVQNIRKVIAELESKPIRDVYPLEVLMKILETRPEVLPGVRPGSVIGNAAQLAGEGEGGKKVIAGVATPLPVPSDVRLKSFALLGGARPGYEFAPHVDEGKYSLLIDTPGRWTFAVLAAPLQQLGKIQRETNEAIIELFNVTVHAMGKKGEPLTPEQWQELMALEGLDVDDDADDGAGADDAAASETSAPSVSAPIAPNLPVQIRKALELITRDESTSTFAAPTTTSGSGPALRPAPYPSQDTTSPGQPALSSSPSSSPSSLPSSPGSVAVGATTYSWDASFYKPGAPMTGEPILHLVVDRAGPFDQAWVRAREALINKQKEYEPGRAVVTGEDFTAALRRARVR